MYQDIPSQLFIKAADVHSISWDNVKDFDEDKIYEMLFPHLFLRLLFLKKSIMIIFIQNLRKQESILSSFGMNIVINVFLKELFLVVTQNL